jgi:hypothetical protein
VDDQLPFGGMAGNVTFARRILSVSWGSNRIDVFVRGHDGQLAHKRWTDDKIYAVPPVSFFSLQ